MNTFVELEKISNFIKNQTCNVEELQNLVKKQNSKVKFEFVDKLIFVNLNDYKIIINKSKYDNKWFVL